jgi:hypothetical protein
MQPLSDQPKSQIIAAVGAHANASAAPADAADVALAKEAADRDLLRAYGCIDEFVYAASDWEAHEVSSK